MVIWSILNTSNARKKSLFGMKNIAKHLGILLLDYSRESLEIAANIIRHMPCGPDEFLNL